ncbi:MAG TPA: hypothetical protein ENK31_03065 [Nannocystis exedens]|nr:hypothetical protein [Nannocystis exedens]
MPATTAMMATTLSEFGQYAAAFVAVAAASGWLTLRLLRKKKCSGSCGRCERALSGQCSEPQEPAESAPPGAGIRPPQLQVLSRDR